MRVNSWTTALVTTLALALPASAAADQVYAPETPGVTEVFDAGDGHFVYVAWDDAQPPLEGFGTPERPLVVKAFPRFPDGGEVNEIQRVELGTDKRGASVVLYELCGRSSSCDLYRYDFATRRKRRLAVSRRVCDERAPQLRHGVLYFARTAQTARNGTRLCTGGIFQKAPGKPLRRLMRRSEDFDVAKGMIAFVRSRRLEKLDLEGLRDSRSVEEIRLMRIGSNRSRRVAFARNRQNPRRGDFFAGTFLLNVHFDGGFLYWTRAKVDDDSEERPPTDLVRIPVRGAPEREQLQRSGRPYEGSSENYEPDVFEVDGTDVYYSFTTTIHGYYSPAYGHVTPTPVFK